MSLSPKRITIQSTLELVADHWETESPDSDVFRSASVNDRMTLSLGLRDASNNPVVIGAIVGGIIDEYELVLTPNSVVQTLRGRDTAAFILDQYYEQIYQSIAYAQTVFTEIAPGESANALTGWSSSGQLASLFAGANTAKGVAQAAVAHAKLTPSSPPGGLTVDWRVRDYYVQKGQFKAHGRIIDTLRQLIKPWTLVAPYAADIYMDGTTVKVAYRTPVPPAYSLNPTFTSPAPDYTMDITALRRSTVKIRKRRLKKFGKVTLRGMKVPPGLTNKGTGLPWGSPGDDSGVPGSAIASSQQTETVDNWTRDAAGNIVAGTVTTTTYLMPNKLPIQIVKEEYAGALDPVAGWVVTLVSRTTTTTTYQTALYDASGPINSPQPLTQEILTESRYTQPEVDDTVVEADTTTHTVVVTPASVALGETALDYIEYSYDALNFLTEKTTTHWDFDRSQTPPVWVDKTRVIETYVEIAPRVTQLTTTSYQRDPTQPADKQWTFQGQTWKTGAGIRPGGPGRGRATTTPLKSESTDSGTITIGTQTVNRDRSNQIAVVRTFSLDFDAVPVDYSNENLRLDDLNFLMGLFQAASGLYEYEIHFAGVATPWLKRGDVVQITGTVDANGNAIALPPVTVLEINSTYDEAQAAYLQRVKAFGWAAS